MRELPEGFEYSPRGFVRGPVFDGPDDTSVTVYESSLATEPMIWLNAVGLGGRREAALQLPLTDARAFAASIVTLTHLHRMGGDGPLTKKKPSGHADPHYTENGGCLCECSHCVTWLPPEPGHWGGWHAKCICRRCTEDCRAVGRLGDYEGVLRDRGELEPRVEQLRVRVIRKRDRQLVVELVTPVNGLFTLNQVVTADTSQADDYDVYFERA